MEAGYSVRNEPWVVGILGVVIQVEEQGPQREKKTIN